MINYFLVKNDSIKYFHYICNVSIRSGIHYNISTMTKPLKLLLDELIIKLTNTEQNYDEIVSHFLEFIIDYCEKENNPFRVYRLLKLLEAELKFRDPDFKSSLGKIMEKVLFLIRAEQKLIEYQIEHPEFLTVFSKSSHHPQLLKWTDDKISLVELLYSISKSINHGKASIKAITDCFQHFLQVDLGSAYRIFIDINNRKTNVTRYLNTLPGNLLAMLEKLNK